MVKVALHTIAIGMLVTMLGVGLSFAHPSYWSSSCASCHNDDDTSCDGCHHHGGDALQATPSQTSYVPGELVEVEVDGGDRGGWVRSLLYDDSSAEVDRTTGPTGTGNDGGYAFGFATTLYGEAPATPGTYQWTAAYFGSADGGPHSEIEIPIQIQVSGDPSPIQVDLTPDTYPIYIGPAGGTFGYTAVVQNFGPSPVTFQVYTDVTLPNGNPYGPVAGPYNVTLGPGGTINRHITHQVPGGAPTGVYGYNAVIKIGGVERERDTFRLVKN